MSKDSFLIPKTRLPVTDPGGPAASAKVEISGRGGSTDLTVTVSDDKIRQLGIPHDGFERPFAVVPLKNGEWRSVPLEHKETVQQSGSPIDVYRVGLGPSGQRIPDLDLKKLIDEGVAFGLEVRSTNGKETTMWLQDFKDNYHPNE